MRAWVWRKAMDEDGHVFWQGQGPRWVSMNIWRSGGNSGDFLVECPCPKRFKTLDAAKRWVVGYFEDTK